MYTMQPLRDEVHVMKNVVTCCINELLRNDVQEKRFSIQGEAKCVRSTFPCFQREIDCHDRVDVSCKMRKRIPLHLGSQI